MSLFNNTFCLFEENGNDSHCQLESFYEIKETIDGPEWAEFRFTILCVGVLMQAVGNGMLIAIWSYER